MPDPIALAPSSLRAFAALAAPKLAALVADHPHQDVLRTAEDAVTSLVQSSLVRTAVELNREPLAADDYIRVYLHAWQWVSALTPHPWVPPGPPDPLPRRFTLGLLGDWGTGLYGAPVTAATLAAAPPDVLVHLGDVYYSGTPDEVRDRFLACWPKAAVGRSLNGNHDMYSGGHGYFTALLPALNQPSSCFAFRSPDWLLVGLDTAYRSTARDLFLPPENDLYDAQLPWLTDLVASSPGRRIILFSHHQPFSAFDRQGPKLLSKLAPVLATGRVACWYWGHEHRCVRFDPHPYYGFLGRCVGHGGFPEWRRRPGKDVTLLPPLGAHWRQTEAKPGVPRGEAMDGPNPYVAGHEDDYGPNGYVTLGFDGPHLTESYRLPDGQEAGGVAVS